MIETSACALLGIEHPVVLAPMGNTGDPGLVAAVSEAGGLGLLGVTWRGIEGTREAIRDIRARTGRPFGINFVVHLTDPALFEACLEEDVPVFSFFRGEPAQMIARARAAGAKVIHQATTVEEAKAAAAAGADVIVAQGVEAGGHMGPHPLWQLLPQVVDAVPDRPVLAAGGLVDGRDLAAALTLGAAGVLMGTRFLATAEGRINDGHKQAILDARLGDTVDTPMWDMLWGDAWPGVKVRAIRNELTARWTGREDELAPVIEDVRAEFRAAMERGDNRVAPMLAGEGASRIASLMPAAEVVRDVVAEAERALRAAGSMVR